MREEVQIRVNCFLVAVITGTVLCILQGVGAIDIGWFWATFPFWAVPAATIAILFILFVIAVVVDWIQNRR